MVNSQYSTNNYKSLNISTGWTVIRNPEMLKFVPDHLKAEVICKHVVELFFSNKICSCSI